MKLTIRRNISLLGVLIVSLVFGGTNLKAQERASNYTDELRAQFVSHAVELCETNTRLKVRVKVQNPYDASSKIVYFGPSDEGVETSYIARVAQDKSEVELDLYIPRLKEIHEQFKFEIRRIYIGEDETGVDYSKMDYYNEDKDELLVDVYKYPEPKLLCDMIQGEGRLCSLDTVLVAEYIDGDRYDWTITSDVAMEREEADGNRYYLKSLQTARLNVELIQSRGPECNSNPLNARVTMYPSPMGIIENLDANGRPEELQVCSIVDDPAAHFTSSTTLGGVYPPFSLVLTNGGRIDNLPVGQSDIDIFQPTAAVINIAYVRDVNGCHSNPKDISGEIVVIDRTPVCQFAKDTIDVIVTKESRAFDVVIDGYTEGNSTSWSIPQDYADLMGEYGIMILEEPNEYTCRATSTINAPFALEYYEVNTDGVECAVTKVVVVNPTIRLHLPSAISPNGDGVNDVLILEGIYPENEFSVFDMKGKMVYQETNYKNDWSADGIEDGHYVYVLEVGGKTYKQMLAIKRTLSKK
ncbi:MAG: gliding motility-associated C-terminal domain-containing protein [Bacteroidia bacterium]|nr:gliding motility-associated C-terminal domain-containing protein [Bacteroidia bacterium]